jgi:hypothetical protein
VLQQYYNSLKYIIVLYQPKKSYTTQVFNTKKLPMKRTYDYLLINSEKI